MYNKELFDKICRVECTFAELKKFVCANEEREYDLDNPLKYFKAEIAIAAIEKYQAGEIDDQYLSYWSNAYMKIIMAGYNLYVKDGINLKTVLMEEITDLLDSLTFFTDSEAEYYDFESFKQSFVRLDRIVSDMDDCSAVFAYSNQQQNSAVILITNDTARYFFKTALLIYDDDWFFKFEQVDLKVLNARQKQLRNEGYINLMSQNDK